MAPAYCGLSGAGRAEIDGVIGGGWTIRRGSSSCRPS